MISGGNSNESSGFTVAETLIVLAVTSLLFVSAALTIGGRQNKIDFQVGSRELQQKIQQLINETANGYYPNKSDFTCAAGAGQNVQIASGSESMGHNTNCVFAGKALIFDTNTTSDENTLFSVYPLAGARNGSDGDAKDPADARVAAIPQGATTVTIPNGLRFVKARVDDIATPTWTTSGIFAAAIMSSFASFQTATGTTSSTQQMLLHSFNSGSSLPAAPDPKVKYINDELAQATPYPLVTKGVLLCFQSAGTDQSALITITNGLQVTMDIKAGTSC